MNDIVDETLGNADPNDYVRFVLKSNDFDRPLNTSYQRRSQVSGAWLSELAGKSRISRFNIARSTCSYSLW